MTWYVAAINAMKETLEVEVDLSMLAGKTASLYYDGNKQEPLLKEQLVKADGKLKLTVQSQGGAVLVQ